MNGEFCQMFLHFFALSASVFADNHNFSLLLTNEMGDIFPENLYFVVVCDNFKKYF